MDNIAVSLISILIQIILTSFIFLLFFWIKSSFKKYNKEKLSDYKKTFIWIIIAIIFFESLKYLRNDSTQTVDDVMTELVVTIKELLPIKIDEIITVTNVSYANKEFTYEYEYLPIFPSGSVPMERFKSIMRQSILDKDCENAKEELDEGISYVYKYKAKDSVETWQFTISKDDCLDREMIK